MVGASFESLSAVGTFGEATCSLKKDSTKFSDKDDSIVGHRTIRELIVP